MLNVNQIAHSLSMMGDQALQQFAAMNKADPYMLSLAVSESNRRKTMRQEASVPPAAQQPKVVDQAVAGIAALPADNMQFADGGIVGFAEGGQTSSPGIMRYGGPYDGPNILPMRSPYAGMSFPEFASAVYDDYGRPVVSGVRDFFTKPGTTLAEYAQRGAKPEAGAGRGFVNPSMDAPMHATPAKAAEQAQLQPQETPRPAGGITSLRGSVTQQGSAGASGPGAAPAVPGYKPVAPQVQKIADKYAADSKAALDARNAEYEANRPATENFAERRELLGEDTSARDKETAQGMALLTAAAAMVRPGQNGMMALISGITEGGKDYAGRMKDIRAAEKERKMAMAQLAEAERAAKRQDFESAQARRDKAAEYMANVSGKTTEIVAQSLGVDAKVAGDIVTTAMNNRTQRDIAASNNETTLKAAAMRSDGSSGGGQGTDLKVLQLQQKAIQQALAEANKRPFSPQAIAEIRSLEEQAKAVRTAISQLSGAADTTAVAARPAVNLGGWGNMTTNAQK
jgi:hypothetical protein